MANLDNEDVDALADRLASRYSICVMVLDADGETVISAEGQSYCLLHRAKQRELTWWCSVAPEDGTAAVERFSMMPDNNARYDP